MSHLLRRAAESGDIDKLSLRLEAGDDIESRAKGTGRTALLEAVIAGHKNAVLFLLEKGADRLASCKAVGHDSLMWAVEQGNIELLELFLSRGAHPDRIPDNSFLGRTALMIAAQRGFPDIVKRLVDAGADARLADRSGSSALSLAKQAGHEEVAAFLLAISGAVPAPPPKPKLIPWPEVEWEDARLPGAEVSIPDGATPAQIARAYILAMYRWETAAYKADKKASGLNPAEFSAVLAEAVKIRDRYCTAKKRVYRRASIGYPPEFDESLALLSEEYPGQRKCEILTRNIEAEPGGSVYREILFTLIQKAGQWRIDSARQRLVGELSWDRVIL